MFCELCNKQMMYVMRFEKDKQFYFYRCPKCHYETKLRPLNFKREQKKQDFKYPDILQNEKKGKNNVRSIHNNAQKSKKTF